MNIHVGLVNPMHMNMHKELPGMRENDPIKSIYKRTYIRFSNRVESWIRLILFALVFLLVVTQILLHIPELRPFLTTVDKLEGEVVGRR